MDIDSPLQSKRTLEDPSLVPDPKRIKPSSQNGGKIDATAEESADGQVSKDQPKSRKGKGRKGDKDKRNDKLDDKRSRVMQRARRGTRPEGVENAVADENADER